MDQKDFSAILRLYDVLDDNGDFGVECKEVGQIAEIHVANKILFKQRELRRHETQKNLAAEDVTRRMHNEISAIKSECFRRIQGVTQRRQSELTRSMADIGRKTDGLRAEIKRLEIASPPEKQAMFVSAVSVDNRISFKEFLKYMSKRTKNLRELYPQHYLKT